MKKINEDTFVGMMFAALLGFVIGVGIAVIILTHGTSASAPENTTAAEEPTTEQELVIKEYELRRVAAPEEETEEETEAEEPTVYFVLTEAERSVVERVVMAEAGNESFEGQKAVAQCILDACVKSGLRPDAAVRRFGYTSSRPSPSESVRSAVSEVFDEGDFVTAEPILYFYAPAVCSSPWHESQSYVLTIGGHRFFKEA